MEAAIRMGIVVEDLGEIWGLGAVRYHHKNQSRLVIDGRTYPSLSAQTETICNDKHITKLFLKQIGVPVPWSINFEIGKGNAWDDREIAAILKGAQKDKRRFVCMPVYGTDGHGVGMNMKSGAEVKRHLKAFEAQYSLWMLEEQVEGEDLRIQVIGRQIAAACRRLPAFVTGNGRQVLKELIAEHNFKIGQGGLAIDITDRLHPLFAKWVCEIADTIGIRTFAFDLISSNPSSDPQSHSKALEINRKAQWLHHTFSEVRQHDIPSLILRELFYEASYEEQH
jgi:glutathione synthase/RimK-type ligase-like ATP-grasp enzyme